eukprot:1543085-Amphidinium_carterae.1
MCIRDSTQQQPHNFDAGRVQRRGLGITQHLVCLRIGTPERQPHEACHCVEGSPGAGPLSILCTTLEGSLTTQFSTTIIIGNFSP